MGEVNIHTQLTVEIHIKHPFNVKLFCFCPPVNTCVHVTFYEERVTLCNVEMWCYLFGVEVVYLYLDKMLTFIYTMKDLKLGSLLVPKILQLLTLMCKQAFCNKVKIFERNIQIAAIQVSFGGLEQLFVSWSFQS